MKALKVALLFLFSCSIAAGVFFFSRKQDPIRSALNEIPSEERWVLDYFFRNLLLRDGGAYVIAGTKPVAEMDFEAPSLREVFFFGNRFLKRQTLLRRGQKIWEKYRHRFPSNKFILLCHEDKNTRTFQVVLINKKTFVHEVEKNIGDFQTILGPTITPNTLLDCIVNQDKFLDELLNHHSALLGMLLGYGKQNSWLFHKRGEIEMQVNDNQYIPKKLELFEKQLHSMTEKLQHRRPSMNSQLHFVALPAFVFDPDDLDTIELLRGYRKQRKEITQSYANDHFLETCLRNFAS